ncbi:MAG: GspL/Epsl periplasmic domain-containing protein [Sphingorhabdus sp.]
MNRYSAIIVGLPVTEGDDPAVRCLLDGTIVLTGTLSDLDNMLEGWDLSDAAVMAIIPAAHVRCIWSSFSDLEPRQAESVARLHAIEHSIGPVHAVSRHIGEGLVLTATVSPAILDYGLACLEAAGLNPDIVIPAGLVVDGPAEGYVRFLIDDAGVLRGARLAAPDESALHTLLVGDAPVAMLDAETVQSMMVAATIDPAINLRQGAFAKREYRSFATPLQRLWIKRLFVLLLLASLLLALATWAKYQIAASAENDRALAAAQKIDPSITDIEQAEAAIDRAFAQKGLGRRRFAPISAGLWQAVKVSPNVSIRELRYGEDGIMTVVLAAPDANGANKALIAIQQSGYRITATPRQDTTGATLVDLTVRMP